MNFSACRICLNTSSKMYKYDSYQLETYYEQITGTTINSKDGLPHDFCYQCAALLHKYHKFKEKCHTGQKILQELLRNESLSPKCVLNAKLQIENLQSSIEILTTSHRVKTYNVKSQAGKTHFRPVPKRISILLKSYLENTDIDDTPHDDDDDEVAAEPFNEKKELIDQDFEQPCIYDSENDVLKKNTEISVENIQPVTVTCNEENILNDDDTVISDSEIVDSKAETQDKEFKVKSSKSKKSNSKKRKNYKKKDNSKKFEVNDTLKLDPKNWLKFNLTEEEALDEFNARSKNKKYLSAEFKCTDCFRGFSKEDMLNRHVKLRHNEANGPFECRFCHMRFKWKCLLTKHMRQHYTKFKCLRCELVCPLETTAKFHEDYHNGVLFKCEYCDSEFKHMTTYYTHLRTHRSEHVCALCGASFVSAIGLGIHRKIKHLNATSESQQCENYKEYCERCNIKFETKMAYDEHLVNSSMHVDGIEDVEIKQLISQRKRKRVLRKVSRKPTDCHMCGKHFSTQSACRKHHLEEHPRTSFFSPNERQICEICGVSLAPGSVASHLNTHTREKQYTCNTCGRQFNSKTGLNTHQLTHTSEKPVGCPLCDKRFKQSSSMKLHYRTFHLKEPYPKRNRKKKTDEIMKIDDYGHDSDENMAIDRWR